MLTVVASWLIAFTFCALPDGEPKKPDGQADAYVEIDFSTLPSAGPGKYSITVTVCTADKDIVYSIEAKMIRRASEPESTCRTYQLSMKINDFKAEIVDKTKLRVYGRIWNDKLIPATKGMVESPDLKPEELPKVTNPKNAG